MANAKSAVMKLVHFIKPPCAKCPYTLGHVRFVMCPCPRCKAENFNMYYLLIKGRNAYTETDDSNNHTT